jgi:nucleoside-diphosphate-sugar epimerase
MRQFISAADICNILLLMINNFNNIDYDNIILSDDDILIIDLIKIISNNFKNVEYKIINDEQGQIKKTCSNKLMKDKFTNFILSDFEREINKIIEWFKENYDNNVRK